MYNYELDYEMDLGYSNELINYFNSLEDEELDYTSIIATQVA